MLSSVSVSTDYLTRTFNIFYGKISDVLNSKIKYLPIEKSFSLAFFGKFSQIGIFK